VAGNVVPIPDKHPLGVLDLSSTRNGKVTRSRPLGLTSPERMSASAWPSSWPGYQPYTTASTLSSHGIAGVRGCIARLSCLRWSTVV
jgi:hypothetical protein